MSFIFHSGVGFPGSGIYKYLSKGRNKNLKDIFLILNGFINKFYQSSLEVSAYQHLIDLDFSVK